MSSNGNEEARQGWQSLLMAYGWTGTEARLEELCSFLVEEGVTWRMLDRMGDPTVWAPQFTVSEVQGLAAMAKNNQKRPR